MAKEKTNWKHIYKVRVHDNRWLAWTIAICVLVSAALIGYIQVSDVYFESEMRFSTFNSNSANFIHKTEGYSLKYPRSWALESGEGSTISFVNTSDPNQYFSVSVYPSSDEKAVRSTFLATREQEVNINGHPAILVTQGRVPGEEIIMLKDSGKLYVLFGKGPFFDNMAESFKFQEKIERI